VDVDDLKYPVLAKFPNGSFQIASSSASLTRNTSVGLKEGYYNGLQIVDSRGKWFRVRGARKLHGIGRFGGYTLFLNQRIRVAIDLEEENREADVEDVRRIVLTDFQAWHGWRSRGDFDELVRRVNGARTLPELLVTLVSMLK